MHLEHQLLFWILSKTAEFNRRDLQNVQVLLTDLQKYRQTTKREKYQLFLQTINQSTDKSEIVQLFAAWKLLIVSERIYADVLELLSNRNESIVSYESKIKQATSNANVKENKWKKLKINLNVFSSMKKSLLVNKKDVCFNEKVTMIDKHLEENLIEHFSTFVTSCKRFSLVNTEDNSNLEDLLEANKKFHCDLFILQQKMSVVYKSLNEEIEKLEDERFKEEAYNQARLTKLLDDWHVIRQIIHQFMDSIKIICAELGNERFQKLPKTPKLRKKRLSSTSVSSNLSVSFKDYEEHENIINKLLVEHSSDVIVQLSINQPRSESFQNVVAELKNCLNLFKRRCNVKKQMSPKVDDYDNDNDLFLFKLEDMEPKENVNMLSFESWENLKNFKV